MGTFGSDFGAGLTNERRVSHMSHSNKIYGICNTERIYIWAVTLNQANINRFLTWGGASVYKSAFRASPLLFKKCCTKNNIKFKTTTVTLTEDGQRQAQKICFEHIDDGVIYKYEKSKHAHARTSAKSMSQGY